MSRFLYTLLPNPMAPQMPHQKRSMRTSKMVLGFPRMAAWISSFTYYNFFQENFGGASPNVDTVRMSPMRDSKSATWTWVAKNTHTPHFSSPMNSRCLWQGPLPNQRRLRPRSLQVYCQICKETFHEEAQQTACFPEVPCCRLRSFHHCEKPRCSSNGVRIIQLMSYPVTASDTLQGIIQS